MESSSVQATSEETGIPMELPEHVWGTLPNRAEAGHTDALGHQDMIISSGQLKRWVDEWLDVCEDNDHSIQTIQRRRIVFDQLFWLMDREHLDHCGRTEIRLYMRHTKRGHLESSGRWGNPRNTKEAARGTILTNFGHLRAFFNWLVRERKIAESPMLGMDSPQKSRTLVEPFSTEQLQALENVVKVSSQARRDEAMFYLLWDTGIRNSELCSLTFGDVDFNRAVPKITILGKGKNRRNVPIGRGATQTLQYYLGSCPPKERGAPLFTARKVNDVGEALTRSGLQQAVERWGVTAGIADQVRCTPHTFRHTFAVNFLRNGGSLFALRDILGHTDLEMVNRYVKIVDADIERQHRLASPVDVFRSEVNAGTA